MSKKLLIFTIIFAFLFFSLEVMAQPCSSTKHPMRCASIVLGTFPIDNSPDDLKLMGGNVCHVHKVGVPVKVGSRICVRFILCNPTNQPITFDSNGVFVGARWNSTTDANNRDFGHQYRNYVLAPGQSITLNAEIIINAPGTWRFWPAYHINGHYGPFRWHEVVVPVGGQGFGAKLNVIVACGTAQSKIYTGVCDNDFYNGNRQVKLNWIKVEVVKPGSEVPGMGGGPGVGGGPGHYFRPPAAK